MLLTAAENMDIRSTLEDEAESLAKWFAVIEPWDAKTVSRERFLWLKMQGVPAHVWEEACFKTLANLVGTFIKLDSYTIKKTRLDTARILISTTTPETIIRNVKVKIGDDIYTIRMSEDLCGEAFEVERRKNLYRVNDKCSSEESDGGSFVDSWVSETTEMGHQKAEWEARPREGSEGEISKSDRRMSENRGVYEVTSAEKEAESEMYRVMGKCSKSKSGSVMCSSRVNMEPLKRTLSCPDLGRKDKVGRQFGPFEFTKTSYEAPVADHSIRGQIGLDDGMGQNCMAVGKHCKISGQLVGEVHSVRE